MASTKARTSIWASQTLTAGDPDTIATPVDLTDGYGALLTLKLTNGATGPTEPAEVQIEYSHNNSDWYNYMPAIVANTANDGVTEPSPISIHPGVQYLRLVAGSNTGQDVTVDAEITEVTAA